MKRAKHLFRWAVALTVGIALSGRVKAAPLDDNVPQEAIFYAGWAGSDALQAPYATSNLKGIVEASAAKDFISKQLPGLIAKAGEQDPEAPQQIAKLRTGLEVAWKHPTAFYFCPVDFTTPQKPEFRFGLLCDAGADAKTLTDLLKEVLAKSPPPPPELPVAVAQEGTLVSLTFGKGGTAADRKKGGGLAATPAYVKAMGHVKQGNTAFASYMDMAKVLAMVNDGMAKQPDMPPDMRAKATAVIDALGVKSLTQMAAVSGFEGKGWSEQGFVGVTGPRKGILSLFDGTPLSDTVLAMVPKDAASFSAGKFDLHKAFVEIRTGVGGVDKEAGKQLDDAIAEANKQTSLDIDKDIFAALGDEWVFYRAPLSETGGYQFAVAQKLRDGERFGKALAKIESMVEEMAQGRFKIDHIKVSKIDVSSVSFLTYNAAWAVRNGYLYVSTLDGIAGAVKQVENKTPGIAESDLYKAAMAALPKGIKPISLQYSNPAKLYPELRKSFLGLLALARAAGVDLPAELLPDTDDVAKFMTPGAGAMWWDADGLHEASRSAFPGAEMLSGDSGGTAVVAAGALGTAVVLPSLGKARELSNRSVAAANVRGIAQSCFIYAADHDDKYPADLSLLVADGSISPKQLVTARGGTPPLEMTPEVQQLAKESPAKFAELVAQHSDVVYLGQGMTATADPSVVVVYEKPKPGISDGISLAFQDAHAEFFRWESLPEAFDATNAALKKLGKPQVDVKALLDTVHGPSRPAPTVGNPMP